MHLGTRDLRACLDAVRALSAATAAGEGFLDQGVRILPRLVASEITHVSTCDPEHPLVRAHGHNPAAPTVRIRERPIGTDYAMAVPLHVRGPELVSFVFNRRGCDFSDRDCACLDSIRPHLGDLYRLSGELESARAAWGVPSAARRAPIDPRLTIREREVLDWLAGARRTATSATSCASARA